MTKSIIVSLSLIILLAASALAEMPKLSKALYSLDEFYYDYLQARSGTLSDSPRSTGSLVSSLFRDAIVYDVIDDTVWVKVVITTNQSASETALVDFKKLRLRGLSQFGNIFAAKIRLLQLPELDKLSYVESIEPVVPDGTAARASVTSAVPVVAIKKK